MGVEFLAVSAIVPSLLIMWFFHARDVYPEPPKVLWTTFGLGVLTIPGVLLVVLPLSPVMNIEGIANPIARGFANAFFEAAIPEEVFKFIVLMLYVRNHSEFDEPADGIVYGVAASLGFATLENVLYVFGGGIGTAILRAFTAVPGHAFTGAVMGHFVAQAKFRPAERGKLYAIALGMPILLHGLYDAALMTLGNLEGSGSPVLVLSLLGMFFVVLIGEGVWSVRTSGRLRDEQLAQLAAQRASWAAQVPAYPQPGMPAMASPGMPPAYPQQAAYPLQGMQAQGMQAQGMQAQGMSPTYPQPWMGPPPGVAPHPGMVPYPGPRPASNDRLWGWVMVFFGTPLAAAGGLMTLGLIVGFATGGVARNEVVPVLAGGALIGVLPLVLGVVLFVGGVRRLNRS